MPAGSARSRSSFQSSSASFSTLNEFPTVAALKRDPIRFQQTGRDLHDLLAMLNKNPITWRFE
jgi:hypothetical protein